MRIKEIKYPEVYTDDNGYKLALVRKVNTKKYNRYIHLLGWKNDFGLVLLDDLHRSLMEKDKQRLVNYIAFLYQEESLNFPNDIKLVQLVKTPITYTELSSTEDNLIYYMIHTERKLGILP